LVKDVYYNTENENDMKITREPRIYYVTGYS